MTQPHAVRRQRAAERAARHATLRALLGRLDRLSPAEADRLRECVVTDLAETEDLRRSISGQTRTVEEMNGRIAAADEAIREVERDRDQARTALAAVLTTVRNAAHIADAHDVTDWQRGYRAAACRILTALAELQKNPPAITEEHTLTDEQMAELTEYMKNRPLPPNVQTFGTT